MDAEKVSPKFVITAIRDTEFENKMFIRLVSFPLEDHKHLALVCLENIDSS